MHPGQIEVNEVTGYWTFLLSVSLISGLKKVILEKKFHFRLIGRIPGSFVWSWHMS